MARKKNQTKIQNEVKEENNIVENTINQDDDIPEKVIFANPDSKKDEIEKIPSEFIEIPQSINKDAEFGVKDGRPYKKVDDFRGIYTDTGEIFRLK